MFEDKMYKKCTFYTYEKQEEYSTYGKNMILFICGAMHSSTSMNDKKQPLSNAMGYEVAFYFVNDNKCFDLL
ncbi:hypothetical protein [Priestia megaterium]|uniref:hypothetical protein n=1 Tax=Priestia megaterium TaxID=1404 RepID=UPI002FFE27BB